MTNIAARLARAGIVLPPPRIAQGNYVPYVIDGTHIAVAGQVSNFAGRAILGSVGGDLDIGGAIEAARLSGLNLLAQLSAALDGDFERIVQVVRVTGYIQVAGDFTAIPQVMDGCSDVLVEALGDRGRHARTSVGVYCLPGGHAVEADALVRFA